MLHCVARAICLPLAVLLLSVGPAFAQKAAKKEARKAQRAAGAQLFEFPKEITLSEEQQAKLKSLKDEYSPKVEAANKKLNEVLTPEQQTARREAAKANREAKKTGKEARDAVNAALKLSNEQQAKWDAAQKEFQALRREIEQKKNELLSAEQRARLPKRGAAKRAK
jgi:hypothetical protein